MKCSGFGDVYKAFSKVDGDYVAIKKAKGLTPNETLRSESAMLKDCNSKYVVRYIDAFQNGDEFWVGTDGVLDGVDCNGVLPLWITIQVYEEWKQVE